MIRSGRRQEEPVGFFPTLWHFCAGLDHVQLGALVFLSAVGLIFIYSTGVQVGTAEAAGFFRKQIFWLILGAVLYFGAAGINYRRAAFKGFALLAYLGTCILLILVLFVGVRVYGATRWLDIGAFRLQPSEYAKLTLVMLLSALFSVPAFNVNRILCLLTGTAVLAVPFLLTILEPDVGSSLIYVPIYLGIVFCAGLKKRYIISALVIVAVLLGTVITLEVTGTKHFLREYQRDRIRIFLNPGLDRTGQGHNAYQARLAVSSGGMRGKGIGEGTQNTLGFLPQTVSNNDFIFSVIAEETGFLGCVLLLAGYFVLLYSIFRTAWLAEEAFGRYLCVGIGMLIFSHMFVNIGMSVGLTPITGLPLPFVSYGGSFSTMGMLALGILQSVYRHRDRG